METFVKIGNTEYPATVVGRMIDSSWGGRSTKTIHLKMGISTALALFTTNVKWSIVTKDLSALPKTDELGNLLLDSDGSAIIEYVPVSSEFSNDDYCVAGPVTDNRDGTVDVKMGKYTNEEILLMEVLA